MKAMQDVRLRLALDLVQQSKLDDAAALVRDAERDTGPADGQPPEFRARLLYVKSWLTGGDLSMKESLRFAREAWALVEPMSEAQAPWRGKIAVGLADNLSIVGEPAQAETLYRQLLADQTRALGAGSARGFYTMVGLANAIGLQGRSAEAIAMLTDAAKGLSAKLGPSHRMTLSATDMLATLHFNARDYPRAIDEWTEVHRGYSALMGEGSSYAITVQTNLGIARHHGGQPAAAEPVLRDALTRVRAIVKDDAPQAQQVRYALADCLLDERKPAEVAALLAGLQSDALNTAEQAPDWDARLAYQRGRLALQTGDKDAARAALAEALRLFELHHSAGRINAATVRELLDKMKRERP